MSCVGGDWGIGMGDEIAIGWADGRVSTATFGDGDCECE